MGITTNIGEAFTHTEPENRDIFRFSLPSGRHFRIVPDLKNPYQFEYATYKELNIEAHIPIPTRKGPMWAARVFEERGIRLIEWSPGTGRLFRLPEEAVGDAVRALIEYDVANHERRKAIETKHE